MKENENHSPKKKINEEKDRKLGRIPKTIPAVTNVSSPKTILIATAIADQNQEEEEEKDCFVLKGNRT